MTTIDISILAVVLAALVFFLINAAQFKKQNLVLSQLPIIFGLIVIGGFYSYDLIIMHLFTNSMDQADAMKLMTDLHLNKSWIVKLLGTAMIVLGFLLLGRKLINIIVKLGSAEAELKIANTEMVTTINERIAELQQEIAERKLAEAVSPPKPWLSMRPKALPISEVGNGISARIHYPGLIITTGILAMRWALVSRPTRTFSRRFMPMTGKS